MKCLQVSDWRHIKLAKMSAGRPAYESAHGCTAGTRPRPTFRHFGHLANTLSAKPARDDVPGEPKSRDPPPPEESGWFSGAGMPRGRAERLCPPRGGNGGLASAGAQEVPCERTGQASAAAPPAASGPGWPSTGSPSDLTANSGQHPRATEPRGGQTDLSETWLVSEVEGLGLAAIPQLRPDRNPPILARSPTHVLHRRGPPNRTHISGKRGKWSRTAGLRGNHTRMPGWAHERPMGSKQEEQLLHVLSQLEQDADLSDDTDGVRPRAALLEKHLLEGEKQPHSSGQGPYFYIGGNNGASIISSYCKGKGWQRIQDSRREDYKLKWCEVKCRDNYYSFREGEQLLYQIPNNKLLTTKIGLLSALREHARAVKTAHKTPLCAQAKVLKMEEFFPETYRLDIRDEREAFFTLFDGKHIWICKPSACNQGKGIFLLRSQEEVAALQVKTQSIEDDPIYRKMPFRAPQARVVQRYIQNPLLLDGKKFDVRSYLLIACAMPYMVFFCHGYARLTLSLYDPHSSDLSGHLTNQFMQKKSPLYVLLKEDTVWSMDQLNRHINDRFRKTKGLPRDWVFTTFTKRMQQIMAHCFQAVKSKLHRKLGYFDLIGCDFLIDENFKVWLLEMNSNPALHTNCEVLKEVIPGVVMETLDLAIETFQKSLRNQKMLPLLSQRRFALLHNGEADLWPRLGGPRSALRPPPPRPAGEADCSAPPQPRAVDRPGARRPALPRSPGGAHRRPPSAQRRPRQPGPGPDGAQSGEPGAERPRAGVGDPAREPSPGLATERKNAGLRGS
ncbi:inactive polyglycylase TTLL10 [Enhydra lutris kenyoni]|uniref:Tubulin--tyrosine ligase-like protein 10 n=1 Tax=Enhydra lutris kenyoni TaxID=391180 RepID=A0A2Y9KBJ9_ENHLU|nr:inactive polyglycylase TTLL10 [Enhydra lutris kenyoni]